MLPKFSVLMSVYLKENHIFLDEALKSIYQQTIIPSEVVLVQDGPITTELKQVIENWKKKLTIIDVIIPINSGLGNALNKGLVHCKYDLIARMDTDDLALADRFEKQLKIFQNKNIDICGSWVSEFTDNPNILDSFRTVPENHLEISAFALKKNPMNHPTVMFKKKLVVKSGGYQNVIYFEDYYLWLTLLKKGAVFYNIQSPTVNMRAGFNQLARRSGYTYFKREFHFYKCCYENNLLPLSKVLKSICLRMPIRLLPKSILSRIYSLLRSR